MHNTVCMAHPLTAYRLSEGISMSELARRLGVHRSAVLHWERGRISPQRAVDLERRIGIPREVLRPDIFGPVETAADG